MSMRVRAFFLVSPAPMEPPSLRTRTQTNSNVRRTSVASILRPSSHHDDGDGDGPYFDLEFSIPEEEEEEQEQQQTSPSSTSSSSASSADDVSAGDLLFTPTSKPQLIPSKLLKSATRLRVFMLRFRKSSSASSRVVDPPGSFRFNLDEVPIASLFARDRDRSAMLRSQESMPSPALSSSDGRRNEAHSHSHPKDVIHKYLNKIKFRTSKRHGGDQLSFSGKITAAGAEPNKSSSLKRLRKSRSASAVAAVRSPPRRLDDSLIQQEDGIQSAIAHCKRSFNASGTVTAPCSDHRSSP